MKSTHILPHTFNISKDDNMDIFIELVDFHNLLNFIHSVMFGKVNKRSAVLYNLFILYSYFNKNCISL